MVLIPKGVENYCGICLVKVVWKVLTVILNFGLTTAIAFQDVIYVFRVGCGTGIAPLGSKLLHQLTAMRYEVLYEIFLDLYK